MLGGHYHIRSSTGILISNKTGEQVDLFIIETEGVEITNNITDEQTPPAGKIAQGTYVEFRPIRLSIEGQLVPNKYLPGDMYDTKNYMPVEKLKTLIKFCNDMEASYKMVCPALPFTFLKLYPTNLNYSAEGASNAVNFSLELEEIGMSEKLPDRGKIKSTGTGTMVTGGGNTDPGSGSNKNKTGRKPLKNTPNTLLPNNMEPYRG